MATYIMSDIHGQFDRFHRILNKIDFKEEDHVYILGDVIDRGRYGIDILQYIMKDQRFTLLLGNHEKMMIDFYNERSKENPDFYYEEIWLYNGSLPTRNVFEALPSKIQQDILDYLHQCPIVITDLKVNDKMYYLVHAAPYFELTQGSYYLSSKEIDSSTMHRLLWERINKNDKGLEDRCIIIGHTMTFHYQDTIPYSIWSDNINLNDAKWIDIDCGCARKNDDSRLAALRLEDLKVFYDI